MATPTERSNKRRRNAAYVIPSITLNEELAADLAEILDYYTEGVTDCIRGLIFDAASHVRKLKAGGSPDDQ